MKQANEEEAEEEENLSRRRRVSALVEEIPQMAAMGTKLSAVGQQKYNTPSSCPGGNGELSEATVFESYATALKAVVEMASWGTKGLEHNGWLRPLSCRDVILMCFSMDSLEKHPEFDMPEVRHFCPIVAIIWRRSRAFEATCSRCYTATTKPMDAAPQLGRIVAMGSCAYGSTGGPRQDQGRCERGIRGRWEDFLATGR
ncbi:hypothetical protein HPB51_015013 [Rhipicephalus microplus]|uniref:Uncharacterized protein n=1 Tax=Rhipicephalus microplus TaxID=6941 RepID=A0A9J6EGP6_RHIMP|nr:hypothetical protein HPB51_015013 [Rhipicephalus microplus]